MNKRVIILLILFMFFFYPSDAAQRKPRRFTKEKLMKNREFYGIPFPFPQTEEEVKADLMGGLKKTMERSLKTTPGSEYSAKEVIYSRILKGILNPSRIIKVVNNISSYESEFDLMFEISDEAGRIYLNILMADNGKYKYISHESPEGSIAPLPGGEKILNSLRSEHNIEIEKKDIKNMEWVSEKGMAGVTRGLFTPMRKLTLKNGTVYYEHRGKIYKVLKRHELPEGMSFKKYAYNNPKKILVDNSVLDYFEELELLK